jgi:hypothetical protein
MEKSI